jgi:hypothetical protein
MSVRRDIVHAPAEQRLRVSVRALVAAAGGVDGAGLTVGARHQRMSDIGNPNTDAWARVDEIAALEDVTAGLPGWPHVTRALATRAGFVLLAVPQMGALPADWHAALGDMVKEVGDVTQRVCTALSDGVVDRRDGQDIDREIGEAIEKLVQLRGLSQIAAGIAGDASSAGPPRA